MVRARVVIRPSREQTRFLITRGTTELLRAALPQPSQAHGRATATLLEGLSLWLQERLDVVLVVDDPDLSSELGICDGFGFGRESVHYTVEVVAPGRRRGMGSFHDLRQLRLRGIG